MCTVSRALLFLPPSTGLQACLGIVRPAVPGPQPAVAELVWTRALGCSCLASQGDINGLVASPVDPAPNRWRCCSQPYLQLQLQQQLLCAAPGATTRSYLSKKCLSTCGLIQNGSSSQQPAARSSQPPLQGTTNPHKGRWGRGPRAADTSATPAAALAEILRRGAATHIVSNAICSHAAPCHIPVSHAMPAWHDPTQC